MPLAAYAHLTDDDLILDGLIADLEGQRCYRDQVRGPAAAARDLGTKLAETLLARGGRDILAEIYGRAFA